MRKVCGDRTFRRRERPRRRPFVPCIREGAIVGIERSGHPLPVLGIGWIPPGSAGAGGLMQGMARKADEMIGPGCSFLCLSSSFGSLRSRPFASVRRSARPEVWRKKTGMNSVWRVCVKIIQCVRFWKYVPQLGVLVGDSPRCLGSERESNGMTGIGGGVPRDGGQSYQVFMITIVFRITIIRREIPVYDFRCDPTSRNTYQ